jgi:exosortase/archaeosortase family protein
VTRKSGAGGETGRLPLRLFSAFLLWGIALSAVQALLEQTAAVAAATEWLARLLRWFLPSVFGVPASVEGAKLTFLATTQEVTPNCLGLAIIAAYAAAVLGTPAPWKSRAKAMALGLIAISVVNAVRFLTFGALLTASVSAFRFAHVVGWGAFAPLVLLGIWGCWAVRDLRLLPDYPLSLALRVALALPVLLAAWSFLHDGYLILVATTVNSLLTAAGAPVSGVSLVQVDVYRYLDVAFSSGGIRVELAAPSVTPVAFLGLVIATPAPVGRRLVVALGALLALFGLQTGTTVGLVLVGRVAPTATLPFEALNDFLGLAAPVILWLWSLGTRLSLRGADSARAASRPQSRRGAVKQNGEGAIAGRLGGRPATAPPDSTASRR